MENENFDDLVIFSIPENDNFSMIADENNSTPQVIEEDFSDDALLKNLLREFQMESVYGYLKSSQVTFKILQFMQKEDVKEAIPPLGLRMEFREKLFAWKKREFGIDDETLSMTSKVGEWLKNSKATFSTPTSSVNLGSPGKLLDKGLVSLLNESLSGKDILEFYALHEALTNDKRDDLIRIIIEEIVRKDLALRAQDFTILLNEICEIFPTEYHVKADDKSLLARFYHADRSLTAVASELDSFDGRAEPDRCSRLVNRLRQGQDKVLAITNSIIEELLGEERHPRAFRAKFPEEVLQENLAGQLWFGAECLAAGSSIMHREQESKEMRPLAQAVTKSLGTVRNLLRDQCLRNNVPNSKTLHLDINDSATEQLYESLKIFDRLFAEFEFRYVSAMVAVKSKEEHEMQELICVLFSETLQRALQNGLLDQEKVDTFDPALMFSIPRLAIITGLVIYPKGPLNMDMPAEQLSEMFRPFHTILIKIRDLLKTLNRSELLQLERLLCTNEDIHLNLPVGTSSIEAPSDDRQNNNSYSNNNTTSIQNTTSCTSSGATTTMEQQQHNNLGNNLTTDTDVTAETVASHSNSQKVLITANGSVPNDSDTVHCTCTHPTSSASSDSSGVSTPTMSPTPSHSNSIVSTTSAASNSLTTSPAEWSADEEDDDDDDIVGDEDTDADGDDENEDIVSADCASGYLIPNTNFGNLLQPQEVPLTGNFIANDLETSIIHNTYDVEGNENADVPTTSASLISGATQRLSLSQLRQNESSNETIRDTTGTTASPSTKSSLSVVSSDTLSSYDPMSAGQSNKIDDNNDISASDEALPSSAPALLTYSHHRHDDNCQECTNVHHHHSHHHHHHHNHSHSHGHSHHHHHHHHHQRRSRNGRNSKTKRSSLEVCTCDANSLRDEAELNSATTTAALRKSNVHHDTSSVDCSTSSSLTDGADTQNQPEVSQAVKVATRKRFKSIENLLHRLFVCIAGVADQLQTNFAADLRQILRSVFLMNMSPSQEDLDIPEKPKESELFEFRASEQDVIQESAGSNQSIYSAEEVNPELDNVFNNSNGNVTSSSTYNSNNNNNGSGNNSSSSSTSSRITGNTNRHSVGGTIQRGSRIEAEGANSRNHVSRSRSLGDQDNSDAIVSAAAVNSQSSRLCSYMNNRQRRNRNDSLGSTSPISSSSSESNSPISQRATILNSANNNNNNNSNFDATTTHSAASTNALASRRANANTRLSPPAWVPDDKAPRCMSCRTPFTAFRRRHHCRNCGGVCSNASAPLPKYGLTKAVRVCRECYVREIRTNATATSTSNAAGCATLPHGATTTAGGS